MSSNINKPEESSSESDSSGESKGAGHNARRAGRSGLRKARDLALMSEEKWLIETLKTMRKQRTQLKMERLHHHDMIGNLFTEHTRKFGVELPRPAYLSETAIPEDPKIPEPVYPELSKLITVDQYKKWMKERGISDPENQVEKAESSHVNMDKVVGDNGDKGDI